MTTVEEAVTRLCDTTRPLDGEEVATPAGAGRVLHRPAAAAHDLPLFDQSAVDGYAVRHCDLSDEATELPLTLTIAAGGHRSLPELAPGGAARIFTGAVLPAGADTVVRQELTRATATSVVVETLVQPGADIRRRGEELEAGERIAPAGSRLTAGLVGALVQAGVQTVNVARRPKVRVFVTGDEVVEPGAPRLLGQIPDSNGPLVAAVLRRWGVEVAEVGRIVDGREVTAATLDRAMDDADLVVTTGGVSVGDLDFVPEAADAIGCERVLWKVAQRPGGPLLVARRGSSLLVGLPGNPAAVLVNLHVHVQLVVDLLAGADPWCRWQTGRAVEEMPSHPTKTLWTRCVASTDDTGRVLLRPLPRQGSHMLSNVAAANAIARVPAGPNPVAVHTALG